MGWFDDLLSGASDFFGGSSSPDVSTYTPEVDYSALGDTLGSSGTGDAISQLLSNYEAPSSDPIGQLLDNYTGDISSLTSGLTNADTDSSFLTNSMQSSNPVAYDGAVERLLSSGDTQISPTSNLSDPATLDAIFSKAPSGVTASSLSTPSDYTVNTSFSPTDMAYYDPTTDSFATPTEMDLSSADRAMYGKSLGGLGQWLMAKGTQSAVTPAASALLKKMGVATPTKSNLSSAITSALAAAQIAAALKGRQQTTPVITQGQRAATPMTWKTATHKAAGGPIPGQGPNRAPQGALGLLRGQQSGQQDGVPINASHGEYIMDADTVSALGDGNTDAGAKKLDQMRENIRQHKRSAPKNKIPPKAKKPEAYMKGSTR